MSINLNLEEADELARDHRVLPIIETLFSGSETPLAIFEKLAAGKPGSFLLESAEQGVWARYSFVGVNNRGSLTKSAGASKWTSAKGHSPFPAGHDGELPASALDAVSAIQAAWSSKPIPGTPPLTSGLVGVMGWDLIREIEKLPAAPLADFQSPLLALAMFEDLVVVDHLTSSILLVANIFVDATLSFDSQYDDALARIAILRNGLNCPTTPFLAELSFDTELEPMLRTVKADYLSAVEKSKEYVRSGDVFQVVISQRFDQPVTASPLDVYRVLRALNPSPYMYLLNFEDENGPYAVVGSSPEALVKVSEGVAVTHPIAGSRPRGATPDEDQEKAQDLLADAKEKAEHLMLVDLARNDLLKVCEPNTVQVTEFMQVERFSHIMHLVSSVEGIIRKGKSAIDVFRATFPAGTLSGAPKPRALSIIDELEPANRGIFGGVVGYFDFAGNADLAIAIRTAFIRDGVAHVQAGAGLVLDSVPESEYQETIAKANAPLRAVVAANQLTKLRSDS
jgi:anthranilate synthase component 1